MARIGRQAPDFKCRAIFGAETREIALAPLCNSGYWVILIFFPRAWSYVCPTEIQAFSQRLDEFIDERQCLVFCASTDSEDCLKAWNATAKAEGGLGHVRVPLLSDSDHKLCNSYHVLNEDQGVAERALFIIDPTRIIRAIMINDRHTGRSVDETKRLLDAFLRMDRYGEACPVDWKKGQDGIPILEDYSFAQALSADEYRKVSQCSGVAPQDIEHSRSNFGNIQIKQDASRKRSVADFLTSMKRERNTHQLVKKIGLTMWKRCSGQGLSKKSTHGTV